MKKFLLIIFCTIFFPLSAFSATLKEALKQTFDNNLELQAERKNLEIQQEVINMSRSDLLPTLTLTGKKNFEETNEITTQAGADASVTDVDTSSASIKLEQTLLDGSGRKTEYEKSKLGLNLSQAQLIKKEHIGILYLNSPKTKNALKKKDMRLIRDILDKEAKSDIYALIISGRGNVFCSGADFTEITSIPK